MPRYVNSLKRRTTAKPRYYHRQWVDPYPNVLGSLPEKMVYAQLMYRGINFYYQSMLLVNLPLLKISQDYRPDFILPDLKIVIEVQGVYWHSKPESIESDAYKQALYNMMGYEVLVWWDYEIEQNIIDLFARHPKLATLLGRGGRIKTKKDKAIDDSRGIRTTNQRRFRYKTAATRRQGRRRKVLSSYEL